MKYYSKLVILLLTGIILMAGCSEKVETVVIKNQPPPAAPDTLSDALEKQLGDDNFQHIRIGERYPIRSFDPLFATNPTSRRAVQLVYEGLVRMNQNGTIIPAIAKRWNVTADSLSYTFTIQSNLFYQDSDVFVNGLGRRLKAGDISFIFQRMARRHVPPEAGRLFFDIEGFEAFYLEQRNTYLSGNRKIDRINGIDTPNDSTVIFNLTRKDPDFLKKLASPYALVYPREAINNDSSRLHKSPVGTGPFQLTSERNDSLYIFKQYKNYTTPGKDSLKIALNRLDIITYSSEKALIRELSKRFLHIVPELGPEGFQMLVSKNKLGINNTYSRDYQTLTGGSFTYRVLYSDGKNVNLDYTQVAGILKNINFHQFSEAINNAAVDIQWSARAKEIDVYSRKFNLSSTLPGDPWITAFYRLFSENLGSQGFHFNMLNTYIPTSDIHFYTQRISDFYQPRKTDQPIFDIHIKHVSVADRRLSNFNLNTFPWWIDVRTTTLKPLAR